MKTYSLSHFKLLEVGASTKIMKVGNVLIKGTLKHILCMDHLESEKKPAVDTKWTTLSN